MPFESSSQGPNGQWQGPDGWLQNVLDIAGQVAQVVGPLVPVVLGALTNPSSERQPFRTTGPVNWYLNRQEGHNRQEGQNQQDRQPRILVENTDPNEVSLSFTGYNQQIHKSSAQLVALGPANPSAPEIATQDITDIIRDFMIEQIPNPYVAMVTANRDRTGVSLLNTRLISAMLTDLLPDRPPLALPGGLSIELRRNQAAQSHELVINGPVPLLNMQYTIIVRGQAISGTAPASTGREVRELIIPIPAAFSFELVDSVRLYYEVPLTVYEQEARRTRSRRSTAALASA
jgi:hypothetical protein